MAARGFLAQNQGGVARRRANRDAPAVGDHVHVAVTIGAPGIAARVPQPRQGAGFVLAHLGGCRNGPFLSRSTTMRCETIEQEDVAEVAYAIAVRLRNAYRLEWAPRWAGQDPGLVRRVEHGSVAGADQQLGA